MTSVGSGSKRSGSNLGTVAEASVETDRAGANRSRRSARREQRPRHAGRAWEPEVPTASELPVSGLAAALNESSIDARDAYE